MSSEAGFEPAAFDARVSTLMLQLRLHYLLEN